MKAVLDGSGSYVLTLTPESVDDRKTLKDFARHLAKTHIITGRGIEYLTPDVEFAIQPMPRGE